MARTSWPAEQPEAPVGLEVVGAIDEAEYTSVTKDTEDAAQEILNDLSTAEAESSSRLKPASSSALAIQSLSEEIAQCAQRRDFKQAAVLDTLIKSMSACLVAERKDQAPDGNPSERTQAKRPAKDVPLVDPPEFGERVQDLYNQDPYWIPGAFPTILQNETGDPYNAPLRSVDQSTWGPHVMRSKGWAAQVLTTFMYWWINFIHRIEVLAAKKWYVKDNPKATGYTTEDLKNMGVTNLAKQMGSYTQDIPGTKASKSKLRRLLLAMVHQIEIETRVEVPRGADAADTSANSKLGDAPCLFGTLASQRYNWDDVIRAIAEVEGIEDYRVLTNSKRRELVNKHPLFVAWYCAVRLEIGLKAVAVPYFGASGYVGVFEWSPTGGMVHLRYILWKRDAPRFDVRAEMLEQHAE